MIFRAVRVVIIHSMMGKETHEHVTRVTIILQLKRQKKT